VSKKYRHLMPTIEKASGVLLVVVGILLVTGRFTALSAFFARFTPDFLLDRL
jgi:cytochrome c-type biogenesis protein